MLKFAAIGVISVPHDHSASCRNGRPVRYNIEMSRRIMLPSQSQISSEADMKGPVCGFVLNIRSSAAARQLIQTIRFCFQPPLYNDPGPCSMRMLHASCRQRFSQNLKPGSLGQFSYHAILFPNFIYRSSRRRPRPLRHTALQPGLW